MSPAKSQHKQHEIILRYGYESKAQRAWRWVQSPPGTPPACGMHCQQSHAIYDQLACLRRLMFGCDSDFEQAWQVLLKESLHRWCRTKLALDPIDSRIWHGSSISFFKWICQLEAPNNQHLACNFSGCFPKTAAQGLYNMLTAFTPKHTALALPSHKLRTNNSA